MSKKLVSIILLLVFILSINFSFAITDINDYLEIQNTQGKNELEIKAIIYQTQGECYIEDMDKPNNYLPASDKAPLNISQNVKTKDGKMTLLIKIGNEPVAAISLDKNTTLNILSTAEDFININVVNGASRYYVSSLNPIYFLAIAQTNTGTQVITGEEQDTDFVMELSGDSTTIYTLLNSVALSNIDSNNNLTTYTPSKKKFILEQDLSYEEIGSIKKDEIWWEDSFYSAILPEFTQKPSTVSETAFIIACLAFGVLMFANVFKTKKEMALKKIADAPYVVNEKK